MNDSIKINGLIALIDALMQVKEYCKPSLSYDGTHSLLRILCEKIATKFELQFLRVYIALKKT